MIGNFLLGLLLLFVLAIPGTSVPQLKSSGHVAHTSERRYETFEPKAPIFRSLSRSGLKREPLPAPPSQKFFPQLRLETKSAYVFDLKEGRSLFGKDPDRLRPLASVSKLMTALLLEERGDADILIPVSHEAILQEGDEGFLEGEKFRGADLRDIMLVGSSNDAAYAIAEFISEGLAVGEERGVLKFVALMNARARELGMIHSSFLNPHGLDTLVGKELVSGAEGTASDVTLLVKYIFDNYPHVFEKTRYGELEIRSSEGKKVKVQNTNDALGWIPQLIGAKTGFTELAGGNLVFIFDAGFSRPVIVSIWGSSRGGRFEDAKKIVDAVLDYYQNL